MSEFTLPTGETAEDFRKRLRKFLETTRGWGSCDKCGLGVPAVNNALVFEFLNSFGHWENYLGTNRHLQPVSDERGVILCEGSPSRWQHVAGLADPRPEYHSDLRQHPVAMAIWNFMQTLGNVEIED